jgi:predicted ATPase/DNA-binding winged helix-turn-helix (wHTH) protein
MRQTTERGVSWLATFGPFTLSPTERLLKRDGLPVRLGGRALDILIALVESAGQVVSKKDLLSRVWPNVVVEEGSLRFHIVAIRKALGEGEGGSRYIVNTANKGYTFVAVVEHRQFESPANPASAGTIKPLPVPATPIVGRDEEVEAIVASLQQRRLVSVVGPGGIGKTTVAIASIHSAAGEFNGDAHFVDLSSASHSGLVCSSVAGEVGLQNHRDDLAALATHLAERKTLIVLDCCEHVVAAAAELAETLIQTCPKVHILATSREPLRAQSEFVYRLQPLAFPREGEGTTAAAALGFPAVRLFVDRAAASLSGFELKDSDAPLASQLCRQLDGIALAIELAAGRIEALGLAAITSHFDASVRLMWLGRRTAVPRHQTLRATLDWSFDLLSDDEKRVLQRLSVFAGRFSLDAAVEVCGFDYERAVAIELIACLVSKSLVTVDAGEAALSYGMLDTTKSYCWRKLCDAGEAESLSQRFAAYFGAWVQQYASGNVGMLELDVVTLELANLRAALDLHFRNGTSISEAVSFAAAVCPLLLQLSNMAECARWAQAALSQMPASFAGSQVEMRLQGALGQSLMYSKGGDKAEAAYLRSIEIAEQLGDSQNTLHLLNGYAVLLHRHGRFTEALSIARKTQLLLPEVSDFESQAIVDSLMGVALHFVGNVEEAMQYWERSLARSSGASSSTRSKLGFDFHIRALCGRARSLWLTGHYSKALSVADETIAKARESGHAVTYCIALIWAGSVHFYARNLQRQQEIIDTVAQVAGQHSLTPYFTFASMERGQLLIAAGSPAQGVELIRGAVEILHDCPYEMATSASLATMAIGLADMSLHSAAREMCDEGEALIQRWGDFLRMPDLLIARGYCCAAAGQTEESQKRYLAAIELARSQGVKSTQVRAAVELAQQWIGANRVEDAYRLLRPLVEDAGHETSLDLSLARSLLGQVR